MGKQMKDWLRFSVCFWHTFRGTGKLANWLLQLINYETMSNIMVQIGTKCFLSRLGSIWICYTEETLGWWKQQHGKCKEENESSIWIHAEAGSGVLDLPWRVSQMCLMYQNNIDANHLLSSFIVLHWSFLKGHCPRRFQSRGISQKLGWNNRLC